MAAYATQERRWKQSWTSGDWWAPTLPASLDETQDLEVAVTLRDIATGATEPHT